MANHEEHKRKLLVEISRLKADLKLIEQADLTPQVSALIADAKVRIQELIRRLEREEL